MAAKNVDWLDDKVVNAIEALCGGCFVIKDSTLQKGNAQNYMVDRIEQIIDAIEAIGAEITTGDALFAENCFSIVYNGSGNDGVASSFKVRGHKVSTVKALSSENVALGSFQIWLNKYVSYRGGPGSKKDKFKSGRYPYMFRGISYNRAITRGEYETRWALQVVDEGDPVTAAKTSKALFKN